MAKKKILEKGLSLFGKRKATKAKTNVKTKAPASAKKKQREDDMEKLLKGMSKKERQKFLESMGFQNKEMMRSYYKKGGDVVSKKEGGRTGSLLGTILKEQKDQKKIKKGKSISAKKGGKIGGAPHNRLY